MKKPPIETVHGLPVNNETCQSCGLHAGCKNPFFQPVFDSRGATKGTNSILVVSDFPDHRDGNGNGNYFHRGFFALRDDVMNNLDCRWIYTTIARCSSGSKDKKPTKRQYELCYNEFLKPLILKYKPRAIVACGKEALNHLLGQNAPRSMGDLKGTYFEDPVLNLRVYCAEHPTSLVNEQLNVQAIAKHYENVFSKAEAHCLGTDYREPVMFELVRSPKDVIRISQERYTEICYDVETNYPILDKRGTKDPTRNTIWKPGAKVLSLSVTIWDERNHKYKNYVLIEEALKDPWPLRRLFDDKICTAHNAHYDIQALRKCLDVDIIKIARKVDDTMLMFYLADQNRLFNGLKEIARSYSEHLGGVGDWESDCYQLLVATNIKIQAKIRALEAQLKEKREHLKLFLEVQELKGQVLLPAEKRSYMNKAAKVAQYKDDWEIRQMIVSIQKQIEKLPKPGLVSLEDIDICKVAEYNAEDTYRTLQLKREIIPYLEEYEGRTFNQDCYEMVIDALKTVCQVEWDGFLIDVEALDQLEVELKDGEAAQVEILKANPRVMAAADRTKAVQECRRKGNAVPWEQILSPKNQGFMTELAKEYKVYHFGNRTTHTVTFGKLVIPKILEHLEKKKDQAAIDAWKALDQLRFSKDLRSKFINNWRLWMVDGKFHCDYKVFANQNLGFVRGGETGGGAQSGRLSCIAEGSRVQMPCNRSVYPYGKPIEEVQVGDSVYSYDTEGNITLQKVLWAGKTGERETVKIKWKGQGNCSNGELTLTPEHLVRLVTGEYVRADSLKFGDRIASLHVEPQNSHGYARIYKGKQALREHRFILESLGYGIEGKHVHHLDGCKNNNELSNLEILTPQDHARFHYMELPEAEKVRRANSLKEPAVQERARQAILRGPDHPGYIHISKWTLLRYLAKGGGRILYAAEQSGISYATLTRACEDHGISLVDIARRYNCQGEFMSRGKIKAAIDLKNRNLDKEARKLGIGFRALKTLVDYYGFDLKNHVVMSVEQNQGLTPVYDLTIANTHNFIVEELAVHNCNRPNLQQLFKLWLLRQVFKAPEGWFIAECDYKSLEPMLMAEVTGCQRLQEVFWKGLDIYQVTCNDIYEKGVNIDQPDLEKVRKQLKAAVTDKERKLFKVGFLAWVYGRGIKRFAEDLGITEDEAREFYRKAKEIYYEIFEWKQTLMEMIRDGHVIPTYTGRQRTFPVEPPIPGDEEDFDRYRREFSKAFRVAVNYPIQCLPEGSLVLTQQGYKPIEECDGELVWDGEAWSPCSLHGGELKRVTVINTACGELITSPDHQLETTRGWVRAEELTPQDEILRSSQFAEGGLEAEDLDLVELLGLTIGDGCYSSATASTLVVGASESDLLGWLEPILNKWNHSCRKNTKPAFNYRERYYKGRLSYYILNLRTSLIKTFHEKFGLNTEVTAASKVLPSRLLTSGPKTRAALLRGLFTSDGSITGSIPKGFNVSFTTVSKNLAYNVMRLLSSLGIDASVKALKPSLKRHQVPYRVSIRKSSQKQFLNLVGFRSLKKQRLLELLVAYSDLAPLGANKAAKTARVHKVEIQDSCVKMWDLEVHSKRHAFVVDGYSVHNSLGSDITLMQASKIQKWIVANGYENVVKICNLVHDSIWFYIKKSHSHLLPILVKMMEDTSEFKFKLGVPLTVEYTVGYHLGESMGTDDLKELQEQRKRELNLE